MCDATSALSETHLQATRAPVRVRSIFTQVILMTATIPPDPQPQSAVETLQALVGDDMVRVNTTIMDKMQSPVALIPQLAGHLIASGGKRVRPMLTLASAGMLGYKGDRHVRLAACVEFIHTATLLHDDVVDESDLRRGRKTANSVWGNQASVLVGDFLFSRAFELMVEDGSLEVLRILSSASSIIAEGEVLQLTTAGDLSTTVETYTQVVSAKTAALFAAATEIAPVIADTGKEDQAALRAYGDALGIAFQIVDDILDYSAKQATLGKTVGDDFREGKITLPIILAYADASADEKSFWSRTLEQHDIQDGDLERALDILARHHALERATETAVGYGETAKLALSRFNDGAERQALEGIVDFCIDRAY